MSIVGQNIRKLRKTLGENQEVFGARFGLNRGQITSYEAEKNPSEPSLDTVVMIVDNFDIDLRTFIADPYFDGKPNGKVNGKVAPINKTKGTKNTEAAEEQATYQVSPTGQLTTKTVPLLVTVDNNGQENIAFVNTEAAAGYSERFLEPEYYRTLPTFSLPGNMFRNATFRCFQVAGNSMNPTFEQNDWVIASYVDNWPNNLKTNFTYVVVTTTNVLVKRVMNRLEQRNRLVLLSDNKDHDPIEIDQEEVRELWYVRARLSFRFPNIRFNTQQKVRDLEVDFFNLREEFQQLRQQALPNR